MATPRIVLTADRAARLFAPSVRASWPERARPAALFTVFLLGHLALAAMLFTLFDPGPVRPAEQEIAVEVVPEPPQAEPPPPEPETPQPEQQAQKPPDIEPATDAPRKAEQERDEREAREDKAQAPQPSPPQPSPPQEAAGGSQGQAEQQAAENKPDEPKPEAEIAARGEEVQKPQPEQAKGDTPAPRPSLFMPQLAALQPAPDYKLAAAAKPAPVGGGDAKTTYLTILYGMIMPHMRVPPTARAKGQGAVVIYIDTAGRVLHQGVISPSGAPELDAAAMAAVRRAGPFPPPPKGLPPVRFTYAAPR